jgi:hypothetical protein
MEDSDMKYEEEIFKKRDDQHGMKDAKDFEDFNWKQVRHGVWRYIKDGDKL